MLRAVRGRRGNSDEVCHKRESTQEWSEGGQSVFFVKMVVKKLWEKLVNWGKSSNFAPDFVAGNDDFPLVLFSDKIVETSMWHDDAKVPHKA